MATPRSQARASAGFSCFGPGGEKAVVPPPAVEFRREIDGELTHSSLAHVEPIGIDGRDRPAIVIVDRPADLRDRIALAGPAFQVKTEISRRGNLVRLEVGVGDRGFAGPTDVPDAHPLRHRIGKIESLALGGDGSR